MQLRHPVANSVATIVATLIVLAIGAVLFSFSDVYDISANPKDEPFVAWMPHKCLASLHHHAGNDVPPADLMSLQNIQPTHASSIRRAPLAMVCPAVVVRRRRACREGPPSPSDFHG